MPRSGLFSFPGSHILTRCHASQRLMCRHRRYPWGCAWEASWNRCMIWKKKVLFRAKIGYTLYVFSPFCFFIPDIWAAALELGWISVFTGLISSAMYRSERGLIICSQMAVKTVGRITDTLESLVGRTEALFLIAPAPNDTSRQHNTKWIGLWQVLNSYL